MKLEQSDAELFYQLWFPLLDFVNRKHHVCPETETIGQRKGIDARNAKKTLGCLLLYAARFDAYVWTMAQVMTVNHDVLPRSTAIRAGQGKQRPGLSFLPLEIMREVKRCVAGLHHRIIDAGAGDLQPCNKLCVLRLELCQIHA